MSNKMLKWKCLNISFAFLRGVSEIQNGLNDGFKKNKDS